MTVNIRQFLADTAYRCVKQVVRMKVITLKYLNDAGSEITAKGKRDCILIDRGDHLDRFSIS